jgi:putative Mg2+ transporter-C (MgtC) family protein
MMIPPDEIFLRLGTSIVLGGAIGYERGRHDHPAGLRTHTLVSLAAALFMVVSAHALHVDHPAPPGVTVSFDPTRIASYVVAGIGFLGGGAIARTGLTVKGLTTAASLWLVTAIGLAVGAGLYLAACAGTGFGFLVLTGFRRIEYRPKPKVKRRVRLEFDGESEVNAVLQRLTAENVFPSALDFERDLQAGLLIVTFEIDHEGEIQGIALMPALERLPGVRKIGLTHREGESG